MFKYPLKKKGGGWWLKGEGPRGHSSEKKREQLEKERKRSTRLALEENGKGAEVSKQKKGKGKGVSPPGKGKSDSSWLRIRSRGMRDISGGKRRCYRRSGGEKVTPVLAGEKKGGDSTAPRACL